MAENCRDRPVVGCYSILGGNGCYSILSGSGCRARAVVAIAQIYPSTKNWKDAI